jgi:hypothetical protein
MEITRRVFLAGSAALAGAAISGGGRAEDAPGFLALRGRTFRAGMACDPEWHELCVLSSLWHLDAWSYADSGETLIRHGETNLAYRVTHDESGVAAQQIARQCWPGDEAADPDGVVGQAARFVAEYALRISPSPCESFGAPVFIRFQEFAADPYKDPVILPAPPIVPSLMTREAGDAYLATLA